MCCSKIKKFVFLHRSEVIVLSLIILFSLFIRLYRIDEYLTFLGDEGRDVRVVRDLLHGNLVFIGPQTSVGNMYLGPLYYYLIAPALLFSHLNPVGPAIFNALLGTLTVGVTWWVGRTWFNPVAGIIGAILMAISPVAIIYSRSSWNPNPMPFFALLSVWGISQVWQKQHFKYLFLTSVSFALALQMHYLGLLLLPVLALFWFLTWKSLSNSIKSRRLFVSITIWSAVIFFLLMSPLVLFDLKHQGMNFKAFETFFTTSQVITLHPSNFASLISIWNKTVSDLLLAQSSNSTLILSFFIPILVFWIYFKEEKKAPLFVLFLWIFFAITGLTLYHQPIYAHYFGFFWPAIYMLLGWIISKLFQDTYFHKLLGFILIFYLIGINLYNHPLRQPPNHQLQRTEQIVDLIIKQAHDEPFNFSLLAKQNYDESYRYFLENKHAKMVRGEKGITDQLFVVCEDADCHPQGDPQWQIAIFGPATTVENWQIDYIKIFRLVHAQ